MSTPTSVPSPSGGEPPRQEHRARRVGFLGTGYIAEWHAKALATLPGLELVAVCDKVRPRAQAFAQRFGVAVVRESLEEMLATDRLDAVHLLLPPDLHVEAARTILEAGVHVLSEKPLGTAFADCGTLVTLAEAKKLTLGVGHNFLYSTPYEELRRDVRLGLLGPLDQVTITWQKELPQVTSGPFDLWMLRDPGNIMLEVGSHSVAHLLDLVGPPESLECRRENPILLPTGRTFFRRWRADLSRGRTAVHLRFSFVPGFTEHRVEVRGLFGSASADLERNTYTLRRHEPLDDDFDRHAIVRQEAESLKGQARRTLKDYILSKVRRGRAGSPYGLSIARTLRSFYEGLGGSTDERVGGRRGAEVIRICQELVRSAGTAEATSPTAPPAPSPAVADRPRTLVLGSTGFIGRELLRQLSTSDRRTRLLLRSPSKLSSDLPDGRFEILRGDLTRAADLQKAMDGVDCVVHLARATAKTWAEYERDEIEVTRQIAETALAAGVKRLVYTGTIDSYYAGAGAGTITEDTPLDPRIESRNLYARAKAASEKLLMGMHRERGLPVVICRPGIVIGPGGSPFHWGVGRWWHGSVCQLWGAGRNKLPLVLVEDVARALALAQEMPGVEGQSFNLVADPCLTAGDYLDELDRAGGFRLRRLPTPIWRFYVSDFFKWMVKVLVQHPERRFPSYRDWESRTQQATFDCSRAKARLGWKPVSDREQMVRRGIEEPLRELLR